MTCTDTAGELPNCNSNPDVVNYISKVVLGDDFMVVLNSESVFTAGNNSQGQLGREPSSDNAQTLTFVNVGASPNAIAAGPQHACALTNGGDIYCWGSNEANVLDSSSDAFVALPEEIRLDKDPELLALGESSLCMRYTKEGGAYAGAWIWCRGLNSYGQTGAGDPVDLGDGPLHVEEFRPMLGSLAAGTSLLAAGRNHFCYADATHLKCWGNNDYGQLGHGKMATALRPYEAAMPTGPEDLLAESEVDLGATHTCFLAKRQTNPSVLWCTGSNAQGQVVKGAVPSEFTHPATEFTAVFVAAFLPADAMSPPAIHVSSGPWHNCAHNDNEISCWGDGLDSDLPAHPSRNPLKLALGGLKDVNSGEFQGFGYAYDEDGIIASWCDTGATALCGYPEALDSPPTGLMLAAGSDYACAAHPSQNPTKSTLACWGGFEAAAVDREGQLQDLSAGKGHACAATSEGLHCVGENSSYQINAPDELENPTYDQPTSLVATGNAFTLFASRQLYARGKNKRGQLGIGEFTEPNENARVVSFPDGVEILDVEAGARHACVWGHRPSDTSYSSQNRLYCWGSNTFGQLGLGVDAVVGTSEAVPVDIRAAE